MLTVIDKTNKLNGDKIENLSPNNLKKGITVLGITGTLDANIPQEKIITPKTEGGVFVPDEGYTSFSKAYIEAVNEKTDPNFRIENIKSGVSILGKEGVLSTVPKNYQSKKIIINTNGAHDIDVDGEYDAIKKLDIIVSVPTGGGTPDNTVTGDGNITSLDVAEGEKIYSKGTEIIGALLKKSGEHVISKEDSIKDIPEKEEVDLEYVTPSDGIYTKDSFFSHEMTYDTAINKFGVKADKIIQGNTILGVAGEVSPTDPSSSLYPENTYTDIEKDGETNIEPCKDYYIKIGTINIKVKKDMKDYQDKNPEMLLNAEFQRSIDDPQKKSEIVYNRSFGDYTGNEKAYPDYLIYNMDLSYLDPATLSLYLTFSANLDGNFNPEKHGGWAIGVYGDSYGTYTPIYFGPKMFDDQEIIKVLPDRSNFSLNPEVPFIPTKSDGTPLLDTSEVVDMSYLFAYKSHRGGYNLKWVPLLNTSKAQNMSYMFKYGNIKEVPLFNTENVKNMSGMFFGCDRLKKVPKFDMRKVEDASSMFNGCKVLENIPDLNTKRLLKAGSMFSNCVNLKRVGKILFTNCENLSHLFADCSSLQYIQDIRSEICSNIDSLFARCSKLQKTGSLIFKNATSAISMFENCHSLKTLNGVRIHMPLMQKLNSAFSGCTSLTEFVKPSFNLFGLSDFFSFEKITDLSNMFDGCTNLKTFNTRNESFDLLETTEAMFNNCVNLISVSNFSSRGLGSLRNLNYMFFGCTNLKEIPDFNIMTENASAYYMVEDCPSLSDTSLNKILSWGIDRGGFRNLKNLGLSLEQAEKCKTLSNWSVFTQAGGVTGYEP